MAFTQFPPTLIPLSGTIIRITSYNVCYTKLLRLSSTKGPHGGFGLGKPTSEIALIDIVEIIDGKDVFTNCLIGLQSCKSNHKEGHACPVHDQYAGIRQQLFDFFSSETIGLIISKMKDKSRITSYNVCYTKLLRINPRDIGT